MRSQSSYYVFHAVLGTVQYSEVLALPISSWVKAEHRPFGVLGGSPLHKMGSRSNRVEQLLIEQELHPDSIS